MNGGGFVVVTQRGFFYIEAIEAPGHKSFHVPSPHLTGQDDHVLHESVHHFKSLSSTGASRTKGATGKRMQAPSGKQSVASTIAPEQCSLIRWKEDAKVLAVRDDLIKSLSMSKRSQSRSDKFLDEADFYSRLLEHHKDLIGTVVPDYFGYSEHWCTPILCLGKEGEDFDDIGVDNLSQELRQSAVDAVQNLSSVVLALRNIVQNKDNPNHAKIIDFGWAIFTTDKAELDEQVNSMKQDDEAR